MTWYALDGALVIARVFGQVLEDLTSEKLPETLQLATESERMRGTTAYHGFQPGASLQ